jgi:hypothetical protein
MRLHDAPTRAGGATASFRLTDIGCTFQGSTTVPAITPRFRTELSVTLATRSGANGAYEKSNTGKKMEKRPLQAAELPIVQHGGTKLNEGRAPVSRF